MLAGGTVTAGATPMLAVRGLVMEYPAGAFGRRPATRAVRGVTFDIAPGETLALVGESGSGKTTVGRCILRLVQPTAGRISFAGMELVGASPGALRGKRREMQAVFQESLAALNPRMRMAEIVAEGMIVHGIGTPRDRAERVAALFAEVGLDPALGRRRPHECSGGQRQRVAIARALAVEPRLLVLDEPVTALDVSVQAQVLNLLAGLQASRGLSYLFIAHDLAVVRYLAHRTAVMYRGEIVEAGRTDGVLTAPAHPYTQALRAAVPVPDPSAVPIVPARTRTSPGESGGCPYRAACQHPARDERCRHEPPALLPLGDRQVACHHA